MFQTTIRPLRPHARARDALSEGRTGLGRAHRLGTRPGQELAAHGVRFADPVGGLGAQPRLAIGARHHHALGGAGRSSRPGAGDRAGDSRLSADRSADRLSSRALHRGCPRDCRPIRSCARRTGCAPTTSRPIAAPPRSTITPAPTIPSPSSARCRSRSRSPASSAPRRNAFASPGSERAYENGQLATTERWTAILTVVIQTPHDADRLRKNPLGVYVNAINWSKELGQ